MSEGLSGNLIIVDDNPTNLRLICDMLAVEHYALRPFSKAAHALRAARSDPPDLFILDVAMPEINGFELCAELKRDEALKDIPVIFLSAQRDTESVVDGFRAGAVDYITKPFRFEEVASRVRTHLELRHAQLELKEQNAELEEALRKLKSAQTQLVHSGKMAALGTLTAGVAHEINNPINFVAANSNVLKKVLSRAKVNPDTGEASVDAEDFDCLKDVSEGLEDGSKRIVEIVQSLKLYARVDEDVLKIYEVGSNLEATVKVFHHYLKHRIALDLSVEKNLTIQANPGRLNQVVANLLSNAIEALKSQESKDKRIRITATSRSVEGKRFLRLEVADNGKGIPPDLGDRIFEPFFTTRNPGEGLGLGLSITKSIVESHGGSIGYDSSENGTVFEVLIPADGTSSDRSTR